MEIESEDDGEMMESSGKSGKMAMIGGADLIPEELLVRFRCVCKSPCFISSHAQLLAAVHHFRSDSDSFSGFGSDDSDSDSDSDSESDSDSDSGSEFDVDSGNDAGSDSDHDSDADSDSEAEADPGAEADSDADSDNNSDSEAEADPGAEADSDYDADVDSDDDALAMAMLKDETLAREYINDTQRWCPITHQIHIIVPIGTLWNPIARVKFRKLFKPNFRFPIIRPHAHPFGFDLESLDSLTKDYNKVVWVPTFWRRDLALYNTLANESWRQIQYPYVLAWWRCTGNFDGSLCWLGDKFSLGREVFREVTALHNVQARSSGHYHFVQNETSIAFRLAMEYREPPHSIGSVHGWVMKQEGHWNKHFTLGRDNTRVRFGYPLGFWKKEEELFVGTTIKNKLVFKYKESLVQSRDYKWRRTGTGTGIDCAPKPRLLRPQHVISFGISLIHQMRIHC